MSDTNIVFVVVIYMLLISMVASGVGLTSDSLEPPDTIETPEEQGFFDKITAPFVWVFNAVGSLFQLMTFQVDMPIEFITFLVSPIYFGVFFIIIKIVRGV